MGDHCVPRAYLRAFCDAPRSEYLFAYERHTGRCFRSNVKNVAQERGFFPKDVERRLEQEIESPANVVLQKIRARQQISETEKVTLATYMATLMKRVPSHRQWLAGRIPDQLNETFGKLVEGLKELRQGRPDLASKIDHRLLQVQTLRNAYEEKLPPGLLERVNEPWPGVNVVAALAAMTWRLCTADGPSFFVTSDNPLFFFSCWGVASQLSEVSFPIDTRLVLHGSFQPGRDCCYSPVSQQLVKELNRRAVSVAKRHIFYFRREEWLASVRKRPMRGQFETGEDVAALRRFVGLSQAQLAQALEISVHTLRNWEQGRRRPEGPALALLHIAARHPRIIRENLAPAA